MKRLFWTYFGILFLGSVMGQAPDIDLLKARAFLNRSKADSALRILNGMSATQNQSLKYLLTGDCFFRKASFAKAAGYYLTADSLQKGSASYELSCAYAELKQSGSATSWLEKYLASKSKKTELEILNDSAFRPIFKTPDWKKLWSKDWYSNPEIERNAINALIAKGKPMEAMSELEDNERIFSPRHEYFYLQAKIYAAQHLAEPAIASIEKALSLNDFSDDYLALYANLLEGNKKYKEALESITKALRINPYHAEYYLKRGEIAILAGNYELASRDLLLYKELYPDLPEVYHQLGLLEKNEGNNQNAMDYYDILLTKERTQPQYFLERGNLAVTLDQIQKADEDFSLALDLNPNFQEAYLKKGNTLHILSDAAGACFYWGKAQELGSSEATKLIYQYCK